MTEKKELRTHTLHPPGDPTKTAVAAWQQLFVWVCVRVRYTANIYLTAWRTRIFCIFFFVLLRYLWMKLSLDQKRILSESVANIGVAWVAGGVVASVFTTHALFDILVSGLWGTVLGALFISTAVVIMKGKHL